MLLKIPSGVIAPTWLPAWIEASTSRTKESTNDENKSEIVKRFDEKEKSPTSISNLLTLSL